MAYSSTAVRPFRFNVVVEHTKTRREWIDKVRRAEEIGYSTILVPDHTWIDVDPVVGLPGTPVGLRHLRRVDDVLSAVVVLGLLDHVGLDVSQEDRLALLGVRERSEETRRLATCRPSRLRCRHLPPLPLRRTPGRGP